jgi:hypothetical protein
LDRELHAIANVSTDKIKISKKEYSTLAPFTGIHCVLSYLPSFKEIPTMRDGLGSSRCEKIDAGLWGEALFCSC